MCGIAVMFGPNGRPAEADVVARMSAVLRHRGPDDHGPYMSGTFYEGQHRAHKANYSAPLFTAAQFELWCRLPPGEAGLRGSQGQAA